jgi:hypothetical protein
MTNACRVPVEKPERKSPGRSKHKWKYNIIKDLKETDCQDVKIHMAQDMRQWRALVNTVMNRRFI